ncbi:MAG: MBL fold metallo-hydrolase [Pseudomonadales bacterium]|jgi:glyoxylase-like metal-dependent hydrolase (beta-lactamase superfamily II)|nr:MBL fold metallo-hydrolase [Pseudomonadales bacterium]MDP4766808.1 MBL fold metallo-hydrolase [Pseudomonadales bacterium]MDP4876572.1 MBL fold metallo-hydrolase [Pseudomonadales bacterium]MDP4911500.1 MBL fold metallo-hydrolase [Pseudomonadales bacterium]MDP5058857.1 MBL fold metallo-hydrolase [Pseudomonadales bacterium]
MSSTDNVAEANISKPQVTTFFDAVTNTFSYVVSDPASLACAIVDPVLNFDQASGTLSHEGADVIVEYVRTGGLEVQWLIETHVHADHLSAGHYLQGLLGGKLMIGAGITTVQATFGEIFNAGADFRRDGSQFDRLLQDGDRYTVGSLSAYALHTPGHTPACMTHVIGDAIFVGDTLFMPDAGTARADFPGGDARILYRSIQRLLQLPEAYRMFMCHDYCPDGRPLSNETTVAAQRAANIHVNATKTEDEFVAVRQARDKTLGMPQLILPSLQVNMRGGVLPAAEDNGMVYLKLPVNAFV